MQRASERQDWMLLNTAGTMHPPSTSPPSIVTPSHYCHTTKPAFVVPPPFHRPPSPISISIYCDFRPAAIIPAPQLPVFAPFAAAHSAEPLAQLRQKRLPVAPPHTIFTQQASQATLFVVYCLKLPDRASTVSNSAKLFSPRPPILSSPWSRADHLHPYFPPPVLQRRCFTCLQGCPAALFPALYP
jgi:hypothetical protein